MDFLKQKRNEIDEIDKSILELFSQRFNIVKEISSYKRQNGLPALDKLRMQEMLKSREEWGSISGLPSNFAASLFKLVHDLSVRFQKEQES